MHALSSGDFMRRLTPERMKQYKEWVTSGREIVFGNINAKIVEMWSFADGERNIAQIAEAVTFEYGPTDPKLVMEVFSDLEKIGYVELPRTTPGSPLLFEVGSEERRGGSALSPPFLPAFLQGARRVGNRGTPTSPRTGS